jgi:hypothetical protein
MTIKYLVKEFRQKKPPDFEQDLFYPPKAFLKPFWLKPFGDLSWKDFKIWSWLEASKAAGKPISEEASLWSSYLAIKENKEEAWRTGRS